MTPLAGPKIGKPPAPFVTLKNQSLSDGNISAGDDETGGGDVDLVCRHRAEDLMAARVNEIRLYAHLWRTPGRPFRLEAC